MADENKKDVKAEEKASKGKTEKGKSKSKKPNPFVKMGKAIAKFCRDFRGEIKKIVWPDAKTVLKNSGVVIATVIIIGVGIWVVDYGLSEILKQIKEFAGDTEAAENAVRAVLFNLSLIK